MLVVKIILQAVPGMQGPQTARKGAFSLRSALWETDAKHLWDVFHLNDRQSVPVDIYFRIMYPPSMPRHRTCGKFYSEVWEGDPHYQPLTVCCSPSYAPQSHCLFQHPIPECARLESHGIILCYIRFQYVPAEKADEHFQCALQPLRIL